MVDLIEMRLTTAQESKTEIRNSGLTPCLASQGSHWFPQSVSMVCGEQQESGQSEDTTPSSRKCGQSRP